MTLTSKRAAPALVLTALALHLQGAWGQASVAAPETPSAAEAPTVVVSVSRGVVQKAQDTPASVDVIDRAALTGAQAGVNLSETLSRVPGIVAQNRQNYAQDLQISSRGYGARASFGVRGIRLYTDGIPASGPDGQGQVSHFDLQSATRVEVLRGPFSALYGNASGGVISLFTADGGPQTVADVSTVFGSNGLTKLGTQLSGTQGMVQYNLSASSFDTNGERAHSSAHRGITNGKIKLNLSDDTKLSFVLNSVYMPNVDDPLGLTRAEMDANPNQTTANAIKYNTRKSVKQTQFGAILDQRISAAHKIQLTAYSGNRQTEQFQAILAPPASTAQNSATHPGGVINLDRAYQGLDARWINSAQLMGRPYTLTVGVSQDSLKEARKGYQNFIGTALGVQGALRRDENNRVRATDQYIQADWSLADRWSLAAGLRHSKVSFESQDNYMVTGNPDDSGNTSYSATNPALGLVFHLNDAHNLYATYGKGFETPTLNELAYRPSGGTGLNFALQSAKSQQWEVGVKSRLAGDWRLNAAYFQARTNDEIVVAANSGGRTSFQNVGLTKRNGLEAVMSGTMAPDWKGFFALTYLSAVYGNDYFTCTATPCTTPTTLIAAGNHLPGIPRASLYGEMAWKPKAAPKMEAALEWRYIGKVYVDDRNSDSASHAKVFALRFSDSQTWERWTFKEFLRIDNLTNKQYAGSAIVNESNGRYFEPALSRNWTVGVSASRSF